MSEVALRVRQPTAKINKSNSTRRSETRKTYNQDADRHKAKEREETETDKRQPPRTNERTGDFFEEVKSLSLLHFDECTDLALLYDVVRIGARQACALQYAVHLLLAVVVLNAIFPFFTISRIVASESHSNFKQQQALI